MVSEDTVLLLLIMPCSLKEKPNIMYIGFLFSEPMKSFPTGTKNWDNVAGGGDVAIVPEWSFGELANFEATFAGAVPFDLHSYWFAGQLELLLDKLHNWRCFLTTINCLNCSVDEEMGSMRYIYLIRFVIFYIFFSNRYRSQIP